MVYILSSLIEKKEGNIRHRWKSAQNGYSVMVQIMTAKTTTLRTLYDYAVLRSVLNSVMFSQISYDIVPYAQHFLLARFFAKYYVNNLCFQLPQNITWTDE